MALILEKIEKRVRGELHLDGIDLTLEPGRLNLLLGPTGAGKTSLLRLIAGLDRPTSGRILLGDRDLTRLDTRRRNVAMVYQQFVNYPSFTVFENIASPLRVARVPKDDVARRVRQVAEALRLDDLLDRLPAQLSGGQQQRMAIARALVKDADIVLLDEPLANLDYKLREQLREDLRHAFGERDAVVLYATADPLEALILEGRTAVLDEGRLLQEGPTHAVYRQPANEAVGRIFSDPPLNLLDAELSEESLALGPVTIRPPAHLAALGTGPVRVGIRPHHLGPERRGPKEIPLPVTIELAEISGSSTRVHARAGTAELVAEQRGIHRYELGEQRELFVDPSRLLVFDAEGRLAASPEDSRGVD